MSKKKITFNVNDALTADDMNKLLQDSQITDETGNQTDLILSQKAVTEALALKADETAVNDAQSELSTKVKAAQDTADAAKTAAQTAQTTADTANDAAARAQDTADAAKTAAQTAQTAADTANDAAAAAQTTANNARAEAKSAQTAANNAQATANTKESAFSKNSAFNKNFGSVAGTVCQGNDSRLSNSRPASDVHAWAKSSSKPSYTAAEVGAAAVSHTHSKSQITDLSSIFSLSGDTLTINV